MSALQTERPLGELCEFQRGLTYGKSDEVALSESVVLRANNIDLATNSLDLSELRYIAPSVQVPESKRVRAGALLICTASGSKSHLGKVAYVDADYGYAFGGFMGQLVPAKGVEGRYLFHALTSPRYKSFIDELSDGLNINNLKFDDLRSFQIPVPGVEEQRRIVAILDEAFEGIATAKAHAEKNLRNAREIFESHLDAVFIRGGSDWANMNLGDACELENGDRGKNYPSRDEYVKSGIPWINTGHIRADGTLSIEEMNFISPEKFQSLRSGKIQAGDLVYCLRGATLGKTAVVAPLIQGAVASSLVIIRPARFLDSWFLYFFLTSPYGQGLIKGFENGAAQPNLGARSVAKYPISIPPAEEQLRIVEFLAGARDESRHLADLYQRRFQVRSATATSVDGS